MSEGNPIWGKRETAEDLRIKYPTNAKLLRHIAKVLTDFCPLSRERFVEAADELEALQKYKRDIENATKGAMDETCGAEKHCTCVPLLRERIKELEGTESR